MSIYKENIRPWQFAGHLKRFLKNVYYIFVGGEKASKPFGIKFEVSALCNLRCIMCPLSKGLKRKQGVLKFENFKKVFNEISPSYLNLTGIGEPLLNPDLFRIIEYARKRGAIVKLDTNATLLNKEKTEKLLAARPNIISISIDSAEKKVYERIRKNANFDEVIQNLRNLIKRRDETKSKTKIHINFVLQKRNINQLIKLVKFLDSLKVDSINGDISLPLGANKNADNRKIRPDEIEKLKKELKNLKTNASLNIEHIEEFIECGGNILKKGKSQCFYPWYYPSITWDGNLVPCCYICDNEVVFGNVIEEPFEKVWNNKKIKSFRKMLAKERKGICKDCFIDETYIKEKIILLNKIPLIKKFSKRNSIN